MPADLTETIYPIRKARRLKQDLDEAIAASKWKKAHNLALALTKQIDICIAHSKPQLDGLFSIGTMWYQMAPEKTRLMIDKFNHKLKKEQRRLLK